MVCLRSFCLFHSYFALSNHPIRPHQHIGRDRQADLLGRFQIDDELELDRLLDRQIGGLRALQNLVHIGSGAAETNQRSLAP